MKKGFWVEALRCDEDSVCWAHEDLRGGGAGVVGKVRAERCKRSAEWMRGEEKCGKKCRESTGPAEAAVLAQTLNTEPNRCRHFLNEVQYCVCVRAVGGASQVSLHFRERCENESSLRSMGMRVGKQLGRRGGFE